MRINLTKKDIVNALYMQIGYSKKISENLLEDIFELILQNLAKHEKVKIAKFGTFILRNKSSRIGRNPKTKENKIISERKVILFKPSKELKKLNVLHDYVKMDLNKIESINNAFKKFTKKFKKLNIRNS